MHRLLDDSINIEPKLRKLFIFRVIISLIIFSSGIFFLRPRMAMFSFIDYIEYWSAARLATVSGNPYSNHDMLALQESIGWPDQKSTVNIQPDSAWLMWNPPWTLGYILPLGWFDYDTSRTIYFLISIFLFMLSGAWLWEAIGGRQNQVWIAWLLVFSFGPTLQIIRLGQVTILLLAGCALFLRFAQRGRWFWAGVVISPILIKPHTLYLFGVALLLWIFYTRRWRVIYGAVTGLTCASLITLAFDPKIFQQYQFAWQNYPPQEWLTATPGALLRMVFGWDLVWLQYIPVLLGIAWLGWYWGRHKDQWHWENALPVLTLASSATAAYGWVADVIVVIPALLSGAIISMDNTPVLTRTKLITSFVFTLGYLTLNVLILFPQWPSHGYWWFAGALWILYSLLKKIKLQSKISQ